MGMRFFRKWPKPDLSIEEAKGEHGDGSSFNWMDLDQADSGVFDTGKLVIDKSENENTVPHKAPDIEGDWSCSSEDDIGVDPYNTGRFDTENK